MCCLFLLLASCCRNCWLRAAGRPRVFSTEGLRVLARATSPRNGTKVRGAARCATVCTRRLLHQAKRWDDRCMVVAPASHPLTPLRPHPIPIVIQYPFFSIPVPLRSHFHPHPHPYLHRTAPTSASPPKTTPTPHTCRSTAYEFVTTADSYVATASRGFSKLREFPQLPRWNAIPVTRRSIWLGDWCQVALAELEQEVWAGDEIISLASRKHALNRAVEQCRLMSVLDWIDPSVFLSVLFAATGAGFATGSPHTFNGSQVPFRCEVRGKGRRSRGVACVKVACDLRLASRR